VGHCRERLCKRCRCPCGGTVVGRMVTGAWAWLVLANDYAATDRPPPGWYPDCGECFLCWAVPSFAWGDEPGCDVAF
jgi:hypothetical protein